MNLKSILKLADNVDGVFVDLGTGWANDARKIIDLMSKETIKKRKGFLFDSFEGVPSPTSKDLTYSPNLKKGTRKIPPHQAFDSRFLLPGYDIKVVKGYIEDTLPFTLDNLKIGIGYIDLGTYSSTYNALKLIVPFLNEYATVIIYDSKTTSAVSDAVDNFLSDTELQYLKNIDDDSTIYLRKIKPPDYFNFDTFFKNRNDKIEARVENRTITIPPAFEDRYEKEIIPFLRKVDLPVYSNFETVSKDRNDKIEARVVKRTSLKHPPFKERYEKEIPPHPRKIKLPVYSNFETVSKNRNDKIEARVENRTILKHPPFEDRYEKENTPHLSKVKLPDYFNFSTISKNKNDKIEARVENRITYKHPPFKDKYEKEIILEFIPKQEIKKGLQVIQKKVSR